MDVADRVQIAPLGYEYNRILKPIYEYNADTVVLLRHEAKRDYEASFQRDLVQTSEKMIVSNSKNENAISSTSTAR